MLVLVRRAIALTAIALYLTSDFWLRCCLVYGIQGATYAPYANSGGRIDRYLRRAAMGLSIMVRCVVGVSIAFIFRPFIGGQMIGTMGRHDGSRRPWSGASSLTMAMAFFCPADRADIAGETSRSICRRLTSGRLWRSPQLLDHDDRCFGAAVEPCRILYIRIDLLAEARFLRHRGRRPLERWRGCRKSWSSSCQRRSAVVSAPGR